MKHKKQKFSIKKALLIATALNFLVLPKAVKTVHNAEIKYQTNYSGKQLKPIKGKYFKRLNYLNPYFEQIALETDMNSEHLRMITWLESEGNPKIKRLEKAYYNKYIRGKPLKPKLKRIYNMLRNQGYKRSISQFKEELAHAHGLGQVLGKTAYNSLGYRGHPNWLQNKKINLKLTGRYIKDQYKYTKGNPWLVSIMYNTGKINGTPAPGRNKRLEYYLKARDNLD